MPREHYVVVGTIRVHTSCHAAMLRHAARYVIMQQHAYCLRRAIAVDEA